MPQTGRGEKKRRAAHPLSNGQVLTIYGAKEMTCTQSGQGSASSLQCRLFSAVSSVLSL